MFKSKPRERYLFTTRRKKRRQKRFTFFWFLLSGLLALVVAELVARIFVDMTGKRSEFDRDNRELTLTDAYQLQFLDPSGEFSSDSSVSGGLVAQPSLSVGYQLLASQESNYWTINERGFRDRDPLPLAKPEGEVRIFLLGGSTAFGYGSLDNENAIANLLEARLNQRLQQQQQAPQLYKPDVLPLDEEARKEALQKPSKLKTGNYRVINAAIPGYTSGNQLAQLALEVTKYQPDLILVLNGYDDLMLSGNKTATEIPQAEDSLQDTPGYLKASANQLLKPLEDKSYLVQILQNSVFTPADSDRDSVILSNQTGQELAQIAPQDSTELQRRIDRYFNNHKQMVTLATGVNASLIFATQPEITGRNPSKLTPTEGEIVTQLGRTYIQTIKDNYPRFVGANNYLAKLYPKNVKALNLYNLSDKYPSPSFIDGIHLTDTANAAVAEQFYYAIASLAKMQVIPQEPPKPETLTEVQLKRS